MALIFNVAEPVPPVTQGIPRIARTVGTVP
jgi:hypothetical protein